MWSRKRFDISWRDLCLAATDCLVPWRRARSPDDVQWMRASRGGVIACLSVRSGLDLLLSAAGFPRGSEVLVSAITIADMVRIIERHGLVPVPLDLDPELAFPRPGDIASRITPRTRAVLIAHLFGATMPVDDHIEIARRHGLMFIEDCAQAYRGPDYAGHPAADVSLFSFGTIKTATALGGALMRVRDAELLAEIRLRHAAYDRQSRWAYLGRILKYLVLKALSYRIPLQCLILALRLLGRDYDRTLNSSVSGFAPDRLFDSIRRQPCAPLLGLLRRRIARFDPRRQALRAARGRRLAEALRGSYACPTARVAPHAFWVFPILTDAPDGARLELFRHGFDSTQGHSLAIVEPPAGRGDLEPREARRFLGRLLFLPFYDEMPDRELARLAEILVRFSGPRAESTDSGRDLSGRTCVITGATSGIGLEIARALAARGAVLVLIGRDPLRTRALVDQLAAAGNPSASAVIADLADLNSVREAAREIANRHPRIDLLVNNAGIWITRPAASVDGFELTWATNLLGHHVLTRALTDRLRAARAARIVNVASTYAGGLDLNDVGFERRRWNGIAAYRQSRQAQRMWSWALAARLQGSGITVNAVHPGSVHTGIYRAPRGPVGALIRLYARLVKATPREGADTPVWAATAPELEGVTGRFFASRKEIPCPYRDAGALEQLWELLEAQAARAAGPFAQRADLNVVPSFRP